MFASSQQATRLDDAAVRALVCTRIQPEESVCTTYSPDGRFAIYAGLVHDDDCESPLESCDGEGSIYFAGRRGDSKSQSRYQDALGLHGDYSLNVYDDNVQETARKMLRDRLSRDHAADLVRMTLEASNDGISTGQLWDDILNRVQGYYGWARLSREDEAILAKYDWDALLTEAWHACWSAGKIGDRLAVLLDVYEHGGMVLSVSGAGMQCQWDTSRGAAVWVPDTVARHEITNRRAPVYTKGRVVQNRMASPGFPYTVETLGECKDGTTFYTNDKHPQFAHWHEAFEYLEKLSVEVFRSLAAAEEWAAREYAMQVLESYNDWLAGDTWGVVAYTVDLEAGEVVEEHACWGYVGRQWAEEARDEAITCALNLPAVQ